MNNVSRVITVMVDIEQFPPVLSVVGPVGLSVELAGQEVEQFLCLPAQQGQPVLKYCQKVIMMSSSSSSLGSVGSPTWSPTVPEILYFSSRLIISVTSVASWTEEYHYQLIY